MGKKHGNTGRGWKAPTVFLCDGPRNHAKGVFMKSSALTVLPERKLTRTVLRWFFIALVSMAAIAMTTTEPAQASPLSKDEAIVLAGVGETFSAPIKQTTPQGRETTVSCTFMSTGNGTAMVAGEGVENGKRAIGVDTAGKIVIPDVVKDENGVSYTVTAIDKYAFGGATAMQASCNQLTEVVLPSTLLTINNYSFAFCNSLTTLALPQGLKAIEDHAFYYCEAISGELRFPASMTKISSYAFSRCKKLNMLVFEGNAPIVEPYAFTGGGVAISTVVYYGNSIPLIEDRFNSQSVGNPEFFYPVDFYESEALKEMGIGAVTAIVSGKVTYREITPVLNGTSLIYEGEVPDWPEGTNLWVYSNDKEFKYSNKIENRAVAYPIHSDYLDLNRASISMVDKSYLDRETMWAYGNYYSYRNQVTDPHVSVTDTVGGFLTNADIAIIYQRQNANKEWVDTTDLTNTGTVRVVIKPAAGSRYFNSIEANFTIHLKVGSVFLYDIPLILSNGEVSTVPCWFRVSEMSEGKYSVAVAKGSPDIMNTWDNKYVYHRAIDVSTRGEVVIPSQVVTQGYTFNVTAFDDSAFGDVAEGGGLGDPEKKGACSITKVNIPKTITHIGARAFSRCKNLETVIFEGDADKITLGDTIFKYSDNIKTVVWHGKKSNSEYLFKSSPPVSSSDPTHYYTIRFYANQAAVGTAEPIGRIVLRDDIPLIRMGEATDFASGLYEGSVPEYPPGFINDGYYAPTWAFPEVNGEPSLAWVATLKDSVYAFAKQTNDANTLHDAFVFGIKEGQQYSYTGKDVINAQNDIIVYSAVGKRLVYGVDYNIKYMRESEPGSNVWNETTDIVNGGSIRMLIVGKGNPSNPTGGGYVGSTFVSFSIDSTVAAVGTLFEAEIPLMDSAGNQEMVECGFQVMRTGETHYVNITKKEGKATAIDTKSEGKLVIPESVVFLGTTYVIDGIADGSFSGCTKLTGFELSLQMKTIGASAFSGCIDLKAISIPETVTSVGKEVFSGCTGITSAQIGSCDVSSAGMFLNATSLEHAVFGTKAFSVAETMFKGCSALKSVQLSSAVTSIKANAFNGCSLLDTTLVLPAHISSIDTAAFAGSPISGIEFSAETTAIANSLLSNQTAIKSITLPETLKTIGANAFVSCSVETIVFPASLTLIGSGSFANCLKLHTVYFEGDPNASIKGDASVFMLSQNIKSVVYRNKALVNGTAIFSSKPTFYSTVTFYPSEEAAKEGIDVIGKATIKTNTTLKQINEKSPSVVFFGEGSIPDLSGDSNIWCFGNNLPLSNGLSDSVYAYMRNIDLMSLENAHVIMEDTFKSTGQIVDPLAQGKVYLVDAKGNLLTISEQCDYAYSRRDAADEWIPTDDLVSLGKVKLTLTAKQTSAYTGSASFIYLVTNRLVGDLFEVDGVQYKVLSLGDEKAKGTVAIGAGGSGKQAVAEGTSGTLVLPDTVIDGIEGFSYEPTQISSYAFYRRMNITSIAIPSTVTSIGERAFAYIYNVNDEDLSLLKTVIFGCNLETTSVDQSAFAGCDAIKNIVYMDRKGTFSAFGNSSNIQCYYTARFYEQKDDVGIAEPIATVSIKEGKFLDAASLVDVWPEDDDTGKVMPPAAPDDKEWRYDQSALAANGTIINSMNVWTRSIHDGAFEISLPLIAEDGTEQTVETLFSVITDIDGVPTGEVRLGLGTDGESALPISTTGTLRVPVEVENEGITYTVSKVSSFAFGSSDPALACTELTGIELPDSVSLIDQGAFMNCTSLEKVTFGSGSTLTSIGGSAFKATSSLSTILLPETLGQIDREAFAYSGLVRVKIPQAVTVLDKGVFLGCSELQEAVFGGAMSLSLEAPAGADSAWKEAAAEGDPSIGGSSNLTGLTVLDDWTFANCPKLKRLVFDADATGLAITEDAFENSAAISDIIFGDKRTALSEQLSALEPKLWLTVSYFESISQRDDHDRKGWVVVKDNAIYEQRTDAEVLAGSEPDIPDYYEWVYDFAANEKLENSGYIWRQKVTYPIDTSTVDAAFNVVCHIDGEEVSVGSYDDEVTVDVEPVGVVKVAAFRVIDAITEDVLFETDSGTQAIFKMPGNAVKVEVIPAISFTVFTEDVYGEKKQVASLSLDEMKEIAAADPLDFSAWNLFSEAFSLRSDSYVGVDTLFEHLGVVFDSGDTLALYSGTRYIGSVSYKSLYENERFYYPNFKYGETEGEAPVPAVLALKSSMGAYGQDISATSMAQTYRLMFGQTKSEMQGRANTYDAMLSGVDSVVMIAGAESIKNYTVTGVEDSYSWTGDAISPVPTVTTPEGRVLVADRDYELVYSDNVSAGTAKLTIQGVGIYNDQIVCNYRILRAQTIMGKTAIGTAAAIAHDAYSQGSEGVIIATNAGFADALSASALAGLLDFPLLLTERQALSAETENEIRFLSGGNPRFKAIIVGGKGAVSQEVEDRLHSILGDLAGISRIGGSTQYDTSYLIYQYGTYLETTWSDTVIIANGERFEDALSISPYAAYSGSPLFITNGSVLTEDFSEAVSGGGFTNAVVVGGRAVVSDAVVSSLKNQFGQTAVVRLSGSSAYDTSREIALWEVQQGMSLDGAGVATGLSYYDALAGSSLLGKAGSVLLLADPGRTQTLTLLTAIQKDATHLRFFGGNGALPVSVRQFALDQIGWDYALLD